MCKRAERFGATSSIIADAKPAMFQTVVPQAIGLAATYEGQYRLGTALARPFIAAEQVRRAKQLGGATLVHGATGKGNDQVRFEFAYRSLAPQCPVLAPWKTWDFRGRQDLVDYLRSQGCDEDFSVTQEFSLDENLWHLSVEGGPLEDPEAHVDIESILAAVADRFGGGAAHGSAGGGPMPPTVEVSFTRGAPTALDGEETELSTIVSRLNQRYRHAPWAWDLVLENRFTGIKSRGVYINPAAKLLQLCADALARCRFNKPMYDQYVELGKQYGTILYRGEYFSDQRQAVDAAARFVLAALTGKVTVHLEPVPYVARIEAEQAIFQRELATFEESEYQHSHAEGFISLSWLSSIGRPFAEDSHEDLVEAGSAAASGVRRPEQLHGGRLVPSSV